MFPLFETIAIEKGKIQNIDYHQARYEQSLRQFYGKSAVNIFNLFELIQVPPHLQNHLVRCRVDYNAESTQIQYVEYTRKIYRTFQPIICDEIDYSLKYANRDLLNSLLAQRGKCDEIMIIKHGKVTDCSIGNLIFRQGNQWFTPDTPLLQGTQREKLLQESKIREATIYAQDIEKYDEIRLINAMNGL
ncbi:aminotransferase class IV family protein [Pasteurella caecimuris]|uniref:aminotransferase class IV family protein n=1 Tax=Rodentibacter caecimuris TaxID=1796644 RepID=UPI00214F960D|nr:aminotransferase class IV family protein [Pasteurella caecimuris]MCR1836665.1 aminotransferase class IV family protein [Pasteurella caecimuris]MCU0106119.1 aminotransferase class IV family protein [Pasteurella caecimuris]